ncbi:energy-coupling factor transporter transmembrane component T [Herbivorax sp. ANBcel31]|uniref:energy-coupling factor transporter transmembrane component T family protein n=1 Tax=Herbivorax sp. ANBcel31 TaxID=3069754 RepID=UPI0027B54144|nr:energy-coupling factor transporter transmembrane component T [Herbivorax sp. ANBcel31]MDQ2087615.1 energy-coupling factor transporter transmembrane component T [Herbivorax sp. ANBcel31]
MLRDITLGRYYPGSSLLHKIDPRIKIVLAASLMITILLTNSYMAFIILACLILFAIKCSKIPVLYTLKGLKPVIFIVVFTALINIFFTPGRVLFEYWFVEITLEGLDRGLKLAFRILLLVAGMSLLPLTTTPTTLTDGIEKICSPLKRIGVPVHDLAMITSIALRFVPVLLDETNRIIKAQASRGADFETGNIIEKVKNYIPVMVPLFMNTFKRADELSLAMETRCYRGGDKRVRMKQLKVGTADLRILFFVLSFEIVLLYVQFLKILV